MYSQEYLKSQRAEKWREELRKSMKPKDRTEIGRVRMVEQLPELRNKNFLEVNEGLTEEMAIEEAQRCLDCVNPTCIEGCPVNINIPKFIKKIEAKDFFGAAEVLKETNTLPAVCGRVCPQEKQCEEKCFYTVSLKKEAVAIGYLERFAADFERESGKVSIPETEKNIGIKVAGIGSGPATLAWAADMVKMGYDVTVFEALHEIGGVLKYGIPEFRLPNNVIDFEIDNLRKIGVKFIPNFVVGKTKDFETLKKEGFVSFFIASGAGLPNFMNIPGENSNNVLSSNEFLTRVNLMGAARTLDSDTPVSMGANVAVIGGGNTAMDAVRTAKRLGAKRAMIVYRRSREEMPARVEEVHHAMEEGIEFLNLHNPVEYKADERGFVRKMVLQKMILGEPDSSGRRKPVPIEEFVEIDVDVVVVAIGVSPNPLIPAVLQGLKMSKWSTIEVNERMQTSLEEFFAGGDIVRGGATVILAMGDGRKAAAGMNEYLINKGVVKSNK